MFRHCCYKAKEVRLHAKGRRQGFCILVQHRKELCNIWKYKLSTMQMQQRNLGQYTSLLNIQTFWPSQLVWFPCCWFNINPGHLLPSPVYKPAILIVTNYWSPKSFCTMNSELQENRSTRIWMWLGIYIKSQRRLVPIHDLDVKSENSKKVDT